MRALPLFHVIAGKPVILLGEGAAGDAKRRLVERAGGKVVGEGDPAARLAFVALDEPEAAAKRLRAAGLLVNVADRPDLCEFTVPSVLDRDPVLVAVGTAGASAGLAKHLRLRLEALLPARLGDLARGLESARAALRTRWPDPGERRQSLDRALAQGGPLDPFTDTTSVEQWLGRGAEADQDRVVEVSLTSDDPDDLTLRQARLLGSADVIICDPSIPSAVLSRARADAVRLPLPQDGPLPAGVVLILRRR